MQTELGPRPRLLPAVREPQDLRDLSHEDLEVLAQEIRSELIRTVSASGGHLGPNLGAVELTIALHRAFASPHDAIVFDTGHQAYVHKMLTGRQDFSQLRAQGGLSGYPSRSESEHDIVENSHASTAISWADGIALGFALAGDSDRSVVAVIGDGALTGGMAWEAINNVVSHNRKVVIAVNDNGRSYAPTVGGFVPLLAATGAQYVGPVDGHDIAAMEKVFADARLATGPVIVHVITDKGRGFAPALADEAERFHGIGPVDPVTGASLKSSALTWTSTFSQALCEAGRTRGDLVAITAAMPGPTGLADFAREFPDRYVDVGIAEQHAATMAAGLAFAGQHPVVAVYATFLNRALDQVLMDCALHRAGVTFVLDRAGVTGDDGASHNGMWDMAMLRMVPGLRVAAPRDGARLQELFFEALDVADAPTVVRFPKGAVGPTIEAVECRDGLDVLQVGQRADVLIVAVGPMAQMGLAVARRLGDEGVEATVVDPRWVIPVRHSLIELAREFRHVVVIEDGIVDGGVADAVARSLRVAGADAGVSSFGIPGRFLEHASRAQILEEIGVTAHDIARDVMGYVVPLMQEEWPHPAPRTALR